MANGLKRAYRACLGYVGKVDVADLCECMVAAFLFTPVPMAPRAELQLAFAFIQLLLIAKGLTLCPLRVSISRVSHLTKHRGTAKRVAAVRNSVNLSPFLI